MKAKLDQVECSQKEISHTFCAGCDLKISDRYLYQLTPDLIWHQDCLRCTRCGVSLGEMNSCFIHECKVYCRNDFLGLFRVICAGCDGSFEGNDMVVTLGCSLLYHTACFRCVLCDRMLTKGQEFVLSNVGPVCGDDYRLANSLQSRDRRKNTPDAGNKLVHQENARFEKDDSDTDECNRENGTGDTSADLSFSDPGPRLTSSTGDIIPVPRKNTNKPVGPRNDLEMIDISPAVTEEDRRDVARFQRKMTSPDREIASHSVKSGPTIASFDDTIAASRHVASATFGHSSAQPRGTIATSKHMVEISGHSIPTSGSDFTTSGSDFTTSGSDIATPGSDIAKTGHLIASPGSEEQPYSRSNPPPLYLNPPHPHLHPPHILPSSSCSSSNGTKHVRVRTVMNDSQLRTLRSFYADNPRPDALVKDQLARLTGLNPRVIRVWFQNKRCKEKKRRKSCEIK